MFSSTSNSDPKKLFFYSLGLALLAYTCACVMVSEYMRHQGTKNHYNGSSSYSKVQHLALNFPHKNLDLVFIGSSRTLYMVDSALLSAKLERSVYNFGMDSHKISTFPYSIKKILPYHPKVVVLNVDPEEFYREPEVSKDLYLEDFSAYWQSHQSIKFMLDSALTYVANFNSVRKYSVGISNVISSKYTAFITHQAHAENHVTSNMAMTNGLCKPFSMQYGPYDTIVHCENGDALILGSEKNIKIAPLQSYRHFNPHALSLLRYSINLLRKNNIEPIIVLAPYLSLETVYHFADIQKEFPHTKFLDFAHDTFPRNEWADNNHLNYVGREIYTNNLLKHLMTV